MPFTIESNDTAFNANQSRWYDTDIAILVAGINGFGVLTGCAVTAQGTPDMTVAVAAGTIQVAGSSASATVTAGNVTIGAAHASNPRIDLVSASATGVKTVTAGTAAASPKPPALPSGHVGLAFVYVPANDTTIASNQITDKRVTVGDLVAGPAESGKIVIPTAVGDPRRRPASPSSSDVEWSTFSGWSNLGTPSADITTVPGHLYMANGAPGTFQVHGIWKTLTDLGLSMPFTVTVELADALFSANFQQYAVMLVEGTGTGKLMLLGPTYQSTNGPGSIPEAIYANWTNRTTRSTVVEVSPVSPPIQFLRVKVNSSSSVDFYVSRFGKSYRSIGTAINPGFTIAGLGLAITGNDNSATVEGVFGPLRFS